MKVLSFCVPWLTEGVNHGEPSPTSEWLVTNGLGGFASGMLTGQSTRRYHGLLIAALAHPSGRYVMLNHLDEFLSLPGGHLHFGQGQQVLQARREPREEGEGLTEFRLENGLPRWQYQIRDFTLEKRLLMPHQQNTILISYRLVKGKSPVQLHVRPMVQFRPLGEPVSDQSDPGPYAFTQAAGGFEVQGKSGLPPLRLAFSGANAHFTAESQEVEIFYGMEETRGEPDRGKLWSPVCFTVPLQEEKPATLIASTEDWPVIQSLRPEEAFAAELQRREQLLAAAVPEVRSSPTLSQLVLAADQFIIRPVQHPQQAQHEARSEEVRSIIAGYHWFTDWGRDTMISLEGLTLVTGRHQDARRILLTFASAIRDGLIPNLFPEGERQAVYYTADASLWFFHAVHRYVEITADRSVLAELLPKFQDIIDHHLRGTRFGIGVDPADGLLRQGDANHPLTWMDAKVGDWIVTPRRGKAVEINALWYNALRLLEGWLREAKNDPKAREVAEHAERTRASFNRRFWYSEGGYLYDVVDGEHGDDASFRPNQILSLSLAHPVLDPGRWQAVLQGVRARLLTPVGLRTLAPGEPSFQPFYFGDRRARDAAYHQGTVWPWLLGPAMDAYLRVHPENQGIARAYLIGILRNLGTGCVGSLNEIFDAEEPYTGRGCIAQAWSVAEVLRCLVQTARSGTPGPKTEEDR
ncbi:MAG: glycogen debranching enzyme family protein [Planctomycetes bacterium]|nr:glycogen debranching enzyme family protein [Planctomycetota bacterium]